MGVVKFNRNEVKNLTIYQKLPQTLTKLIRNVSCDEFIYLLLVKALQSSDRKLKKM